MANVKIILRKEVKKDGTSPLAIRITKDRKSSYIYLEYSIKESDWDKENQRVRKSHVNSARLNNYLIKKRAEAVDSSIDVESTKKTASAKNIRQKIKPTTGGTVFEQADLYIRRLEEDGKYNQYSAGKPRVKHLKAYLKTDIAFQDFTIQMIERFKAWLKSTYKMSERTAVNHLVILRSIFSQAIKEGACEEKYYPFGKGKIKIKFPDSTKIGLTIEDIANLEAVKLEQPANHARNLWLLSFYFAGMRISDVLLLKWSDFQDGRLYYTMGKNDKGGSLKIPDKAIAILKQYEHLKEKKTDLVFPDLKGINLQNRFETQKRIASRTNTIDQLLRDDVSVAAKVDKKLTMHIARHTFGNLSGDKIPIQMLQKLYRHSSITTTIGYQANFIHKDVDDALNSVVG
ncbi:MAG: site-specific integrase [Flavipsychrobacter sp.]|nr:site-specific integrase [Flavipsychrobacter sp.]